MRLPFSVLGVSSIPVEQVCSRRMWNGADGGRFGDGDRDGNGEEDEIVYIGKNSTRYHRLRTCHYLYNDLKAVDLGAVGELRNEAGGRYSSWGHAVEEAEAQEAGAREAAVWGAAVRFMSCHMVQATMCLKAAGPSLRMFRRFH